MTFRALRPLTPAPLPKRGRGVPCRVAGYGRSITPAGGVWRKFRREILSALDTSTDFVSARGGFCCTSRAPAFASSPPPSVRCAACHLPRFAGEDKRATGCDSILPCKAGACEDRGSPRDLPSKARRAGGGCARHHSGITEREVCRAGFIPPQNPRCSPGGINPALRDARLPLPKPRPQAGV